MLKKQGSKNTEVHVAHAEQLEQALEKITGAQYRDILHELDKVVDANTTFDTTQLKGHDFQTKVFAPLLAVTDDSEKQMRQLLESILMDYLITRPDKTWTYHHENRDQLGEDRQAAVFEVSEVTPA